MHPRDKNTHHLALLLWNVAKRCQQRSALETEIKYIPERAQKSAIDFRKKYDAMMSATDLSKPFELISAYQKNILDLKTRLVLVEKILIHHDEKDIANSSIKKQHTVALTLAVKRRTMMPFFNVLLKEVRNIELLKKYLISEDITLIAEFFRNHKEMVNIEFSCIHEEIQYSVTPLMFCIIKNFKKNNLIIPLLLSSNADIDHQSRSNGYTVLHWAIKLGAYQNITTVLSVQPDLTLKDMHGNTSLMLLKASGRNDTLSQKLISLLDGTEKMAQAPKTSSCVIS